MPSDIDDSLLAAILSVGLQFGVVSKLDAIAWADQEIDRRSEIPSWLIDLSMSNSEGLRRVDVVGVLRGVGGHGNEERVCIGIYSLLPDLTNCTYDECDAIAKRLYEITRSVFKGDFSCALLMEMMDVYEVFDGWAFGCLSHDQLKKMLQDFVEVKKDQAICNRLKPVKYVVQKDVQNP